MTVGFLGLGVMGQAMAAVIRALEARTGSGR